MAGTNGNPQVCELGSQVAHIRDCRLGGWDDSSNLRLLFGSARSSPAIRRAPRPPTGPDPSSSAYAFVLLFTLNIHPIRRYYLYYAVLLPFTPVCFSFKNELTPAGAVPNIAEAMPKKPPSVCRHSGCPNLATRGSKCPEHDYEGCGATGARQVAHIIDRRASPEADKDLAIGDGSTPECSCLLLISILYAIVTFVYSDRTLVHARLLFFQESVDTGPSCF